MPSKELASARPDAKEGATLAGDIEVLNALQPVAVCTWVRTKHAPPGMRSVSWDALRDYLGLTSEQVDAMDRVFSFCLHLIATYRLTPASAVGELVHRGLELERSIFLVDPAAVEADYERRSAEIESTAKVGEIVRRLDGLEAALECASASDQ